SLRTGSRRRPQDLDRSRVTVVIHSWEMPNLALDASGLLFDTAGDAPKPQVNSGSFRVKACRLDRNIGIELRLLLPLLLQRKLNDWRFSFSDDELYRQIIR